ncbi:hypothetical protein BGX28_007001 [Mortierella sp. GBA30]|nr:hypothetical protein BGX28_007001 [Mortierella sp. GBA30]
MLLIKSILVLCAATAVLAKDRFDAVSSLGYFSGQDISDHGAKGLPVFKDRKNRASAVASIVEYCADKADFLPSEYGVEVAPSAYTEFFKNIATFPALFKTDAKTTKIELDGTIEQLVNEIQLVYEEFQDEDEDYPFDDQIPRNFRRLLPATLPDPNQHRWLLSQVVIQKVQYFDKYRVEIARVALKLSKGEDGAALIDEQTATFSRNVYMVDTHYIQNNAEALAYFLPITNVDDLNKFLTTKKSGLWGSLPEEESCDEREDSFFGRNRFEQWKL